MKVSYLASFILIIAISFFGFFFAGRKINSTVEECIKNNYLTEIDSLKDKLNKQSELIDSIIQLNDKVNSTEEQTKDTSNEQTESTEKCDYEFVIENNGITITKYIGKQVNVSIPSKIDKLPVLKIGENAFAETKVKSITLPSSCKEIDWFAFYGCFALKTIYISSGVESIGYGAFDGCSKSLTIYCENDSFAEKYAQSFGIDHSYFQ